MSVMTGTMAPTQILAEVMTTAQDRDPNYAGKGSGKKLLAFSDSRSSAAQFAAGLERVHRVHVQRAAIYEALKGATEPVGIDELAGRVARVLTKRGFYRPNPNNTFRARGVVFTEFTASYANRRRLESLGLAASEIYFDSPPPKSLVTMVGSELAAQAVSQALLSIMQYDSAVTKPEAMPQASGVACATTRNLLRAGLWFETMGLTDCAAISEKTATTLQLCNESGWRRECRRAARGGLEICAC